MEPISLGNISITKGPAKSADFNRIISDIHTDIDNIFDINNQNTKLIDETLDIYIHENYFLKRQVENLKAQLRSTVAMVESLRESDDLKTLYSTLSDAIYVNATHEHNLYTLPAGSRTSKLSIISDEDIYIPSSTKVEILESIDGENYYELDASTDFLKNEYWTRTLRVNENQGISKVFCKIRITVPIEIINNIYSNVLKIIPFPFYGTTVDKIRYKNIAGTWNTLEYKGPITVFEDQDIFELEIDISQTNYFTEGNYRFFTYGLRELGLYYYDFLNDGSIIIPFSIANTSAYFRSIKEPEKINGIEYQLYTDELLTREVWFDYELLENLQTVYLKINLNKTDVIPTIKEVKLQFYVRSAN